MKLRCPKCKKMLPQIGADALPGEPVVCGMCGYIFAMQGQQTASQRIKKQRMIFP